MSVREPLAIAATAAQFIPGIGTVVGGVLSAALALAGPAGTGGPRQIDRLLAVGCPPEIIALINCNPGALGFEDGALALKAFSDYLGVPPYYSARVVEIPAAPGMPPRSKIVRNPPPPRSAETMALIERTCGRTK